MLFAVLGIARGAFADYAGEPNPPTTSPNPSVYGQTVLFTVMLQGNGTYFPTGTFTIQDDITAATICTGSMFPYQNPTISRGTCSASNLTVGSHPYGVNYSGDSIYSVAGYVGATQTVNPFPSVLQYFGATASNYGQAFGFNNQVVRGSVTGVPPPAPAPTGTVSVTVNGTAAGSMAVDSGITLPKTALPGGTDTMVLSYGGDSIYAASTLTITLTVARISGTTTAGTTSLTPAVYGQPVHFHATVTLNDTTLATPTGTLSLQNGFGGTVYATVPVTVVNPSTVQADFFITGIPVGTYTLEARYDGDGNYLRSFSAIAQEIDVNPTTTAVTTSTASAVYGQPVMLTATITPAVATTEQPFGSVTFTDNGTPIGTPVVVNGVGTLITSTLTSGTHTIAASYNGDGNFGVSSGTATPDVVVTSDGTTLNLGVSPPSGVYGEPVTLTATVTPNAPGTGFPTGSIDFSDGANVIGSGTLTNGVATLTTAAFAPGLHNLSAAYAGDGNYNASASATTAMMTDTSLTNSAVTSSANPAFFGQTVTISATVTPVAPGAGVPTGTVTFLDGGTAVGTAPLDASGVARFVSNSLSIGSHAFSATYPGDANFDGSGASMALPQTIFKAPAVVALTSSQNPASFQQLVTYTAMVSGAGATPTGTVTFTDNGSTLGTFPLTGLGQAVYSSDPSVGAHTIEAIYNGDANYSGSTGELTGNPQVVIGAPVVDAQFNPSSIALGATSQLHFTITNPAPNVVALLGVSLNDTLPAALTVASGTSPVCGGTLTVTAPGSIALSGATIAVGGQCVFDVTVNGAAGGNFTTTTGQVTSTNGSVGGNQATASITVGACTFSIPSGITAPAGGMSGSFNVYTQAGCSWTAISNAGWLTTSSSGTGNGTVSYTIAADTMVSGRSGAITVGVPSFSVTQLGVAPPALTLTSSAPPVSLTWNSSDVDHFEIWRNNILLTTTASKSFTDATAVANQAYVYQVLAVDSAGDTSAFSNPVLAVTVTFTDNPLTAGMPIRAVDVQELRDAVTLVSSIAGVAAPTFTDPALAGVPVKAVHILEVRSAFDLARAALGLPPVTYTNNIDAGSGVSVTDILDLRQGLAH